MSQGAAKAVQADKAASQQPTRWRDGPETSPAFSIPRLVGLLQGHAGNGAVTQLLGGGAPLAADLRAEMEERFGTAFADVRIHDDARSRASAVAFGADAYALGSDIVFSEGRFAPGSLEGKRLLAHELAHVVQQRRGGAIPGPISDARGSPLEAGADRAAESTVSTSGPVEVTGASAPGIALQPAHTKQTPDPQTLERASKESTALDPARAAQEMFKAVESMTYLGQAGRYSIEVNGRLYEIDESRYQQNLTNARKAVLGLVNTIRKGAGAIEHSHAAILETNRQWPYVPVVKATEYFYGVEAPGDELTIPLGVARNYTQEAEAALARNDFSIAFEQLEWGHAAMLQADEAVEAYRQALVEKSTELFQAVDGYRKAFNNVLIGIGAVLLAPEVLTVGAVATIIGGAGVVGGATEGAVDLTKQAITGEGIDPQQTLQEATAGVKGGVVSATAGLVTGGTARWLGPGTTATQTAGRMGLAGSAGGSVGGGLGAALEGKSAGEVASQAFLGAAEGFVGGFAGGATTYLTGGLRLPARVAVGALGGGASSGAAAWAVGRSPEEVAQAIFVGGIAGGVVAGIDAPGTRQASPEESLTTRSSRTRPKQMPRWEELGQDVDFGIKVFKSGDVRVGVHPDYPETIFLLQSEGPPRVFTRHPNGTVTEGPWPFGGRASARAGTPGESADGSNTPSSGGPGSGATESNRGSPSGSSGAQASNEPAATTSKTLGGNDEIVEQMLTHIEDPQLPVRFDPRPRVSSNMISTLEEVSKLELYETHYHLKGGLPYGRMLTLGMVNAVSGASPAPRRTLADQRRAAEDWFEEAGRLLYAQNRPLNEMPGLRIRLQALLDEIEQINAARRSRQDVVDRLQQARTDARQLGLEIEEVLSMPIGLENAPEWARFFQFYSHVGTRSKPPGEMEALRMQAAAGTAGLEARSGSPLPQGQHIDLQTGNRVPSVDPMPAGTTRIVAVGGDTANKAAEQRGLLDAQLRSFDQPGTIRGHEKSGIEQEGQGLGVIVDLSLRAHAQNYLELADWLAPRPATTAAIWDRLGYDPIQTLSQEYRAVLDALIARDTVIDNALLPGPLPPDVPLAAFAARLRQVREAIAIARAEALPGSAVANELGQGMRMPPMQGITIHAGEQLMSGEATLPFALTQVEEAIAAGTDRIGHGTILGIRFPEDLPQLGFHWTGSHWERDVPRSQENVVLTQRIYPEEIPALEKRRLDALRRISALGIVIEVPPTSNIRLQGFHMFEHPVARMLADEPDLRVVPATDNPAIHRTDIRRETALLAANSAMSRGRRTVTYLESWASRLGARAVPNDVELRDAVVEGIVAYTPAAERLDVLRAIHQRWPIGGDPTREDAANESAFAAKLRLLVGAVIY